jgi:hypothetical protein
VYDGVVEGNGRIAILSRFRNYFIYFQKKKGSIWRVWKEFPKALLGNVSFYDPATTGRYKRYWYHDIGLIVRVVIELEFNA